MKQILQNELSKSIHPDIVKEILNEYESVCKDFSVENDLGILSSSGRFVDMVLAGIKYWYDPTTPINLNTVSFDALYNTVTGFPRRTRDSEEDLLLLEIPNVAKAIYTIRNKKRGAHRKDFDPIMQDRMFLKNSVDWIISSLLFVFHTKSEEEIQEIIDTLIQKEVPLIEEFEDGGILILEKMSLKDTILILLYRQSGIITTEQLKGNLDKRHHKNFFTALGRLKNEFLVYVNGKNVKITRKGIAQVETQILRNK